MLSAIEQVVSIIKNLAIKYRYKLALNQIGFLLDSIIIHKYIQFTTVSYITY